MDSSEPWTGLTQSLVGKHPCSLCLLQDLRFHAVHIRSLQADSSKPETKAPCSCQGGLFSAKLCGGVGTRTSQFHCNIFLVG